MDSLTVVIPAYNEEKRIGKTLEKIFAYLRKHVKTYEIIVVDDGSTDNTVTIVNKMGVKVLTHTPNRGKGHSVRQGILASTKKYVLFSDADLSTPIEELSVFMKEIDSKKYDAIIASRKLKESKIMVKQPFFRSSLGKTFPYLVNLFLFLGIKDTQCGFKLFKTDVAKRIFRMQKIEGFGFDVEVVFLLIKKGYTVKELPVQWFNDTASKVNSIKDSVEMFCDLFRIRWNWVCGRYK